jgi:molybdenum cofactor cytidylyltransferase
MGGPKQLLRLGRVTVLEQVLKTFRASKADEVLVVLGVHSGVTRGRLLGAKVVLNPDSSGGISSSIRVGLAAIDRNSEAVLFGLADKPFVSVATINRIIASYQTSRIGIVIPVYRGRRGNPVLFARDFFDQLGTLSGDVGGKAVIRKHAESIREVEVDDDGILVDIDTRADFERAKTRLTQSKRRSPR